MLFRLIIIAIAVAAASPLYTAGFALIREVATKLAL
jgi:hypothetical protein